MDFRGWFHRCGVLVIAVVGSVAMTVILAITVQSLTQFDKEPVDYLPASQTVAVFHVPQWQTLQDFIPWYPELAAVKSKPVDRTIAIVETGKGQEILEWIRASDIPNESDFHQLGAFALYGSDTARSLLDTPTHTLQDDDQYRAFASAIPTKTTWAFIRTESIQASKDLHGDLWHSLLIGNTPILAFYENGNSRTIIRFDTQKHLQHATPRPPIGDLQSILSMSAQSLQSIWEHIMQNISTQHRSILNGIAYKKLTQIFGDHISLEYDILPLFTETTVIHLSQSGSQVQLQLAGSYDRAQHILNRMHEGLLSQLPTARFDTHNFDNRFTHTSIRSDHSNVVDSEYNIEDWVVRETRRTSNRHGLFTALHNNHFAISTTHDGLLDIISEDAHTLAPIPTLKSRKRSTLLMGGRVLPKQTRELFATIVPIERSHNPLLGNLKTETLWSVHSQGKFTYITIQEAE